MAISDVDAELAAALGEAPDTETSHEAADSGEGEVSQPRPVASGKEDSTREAAPQPEAENEGEKDARYRALLGKLQKYEKYEPLLDILEEEPAIARRIVAQRLGLLDDEQPRTESAPQATSPAWTPEQVQEYWRAEFERDPVQALTKLVSAVVQQQTAPQARTSLRSLTAAYKADRRAADPMFQHYEPYFDALLKAADPEKVMQDPDAAFAAMERLAFGTWAMEQREKARRAKGKKPPQEPPRSLDVGKLTEARSPSKPRRQLTPEEQELARLYGEDLVRAALEEEESAEEGVW